ncbi:hypothetical protein [Pseudoalteromonas galatheae]|uniref:hypothetical protein n=1 Tax=Pseudoalteromonas galatheae TaxID=579562 RepID=UPI0030D21716
MFEKIFKGDGELHTASWEAQKWLRENGYSYGPMERDNPIAVLKGADHDLPKWTNLPDDLKEKVDGKLHVTMKGDARLVLNEEPSYN